MGRAVSLADVVAVPISSIVIGERRREKLGRLQALKKSIEAHGLIHPILLRGQTLVAGHRRLEACRALEWRTIPARQVTEKQMSEDELRAIELDENTTRENLSDYETSKTRLAQIRQAEADLKNETRSNLEQVSTRKKRGPARRAGSKRDIAERTGIPLAEQARVERHVDLAERYPFMQRRGWLRHHVLDAGDQIEELPEEDRAPIAALLDQDAIPPAKVIELLTNAATMPKARRQAIIERSTAADEFERRTALTDLAEVPPPPDPGLLALHDADRAIQRAATSCRSTQFKPRLEELSSEVGTVLKAFSASEKEARSHGSPV